MFLERLIDNFAVEVEPFAVCEISCGWSLLLDGTPWLTFHYVVRGEGRIRTPRATIELAPYTLVLVPPQLPHTLDRGDGGGRQQTGPSGTRDVDGQIEFIAGADGDRELCIMCGRLNATYGDEGPGVFDLLDHTLVLDFAGEKDMTQVFNQIYWEQQVPSPGSRAMTNALMTGCLVKVFRKLIEGADTDLAWLEGLADPRLVGVIEAVLVAPEAPHTVESMAEQAAMSRSAFHARFTDSFGRTPSTFVREVRLRRAAEMLVTTDLGIDDIGSRVGFASRSQFSSAFRQLFGCPPAQFRAAH